jgi:hypothetical protein
MNPGGKLSVFINRAKPAVPKRHLLLVAALAWTTAGGILLARGTAYMSAMGDHLLWRCAIALVGGLVFFVLLFARISLKHIARIHAIEVVSPCLFSFFDFKAYLLMALMIAGSVSLRLLRLIDPLTLANFYVCMATPLLMSAVRFYYAFATYRRLPCWHT